MAGEVHLNTKIRGATAGEVTLTCGALRAGALVSGDPAQVTCSKCKGS